jgi:hypothetical protein
MYLGNIEPLSRGAATSYRASALDSEQAGPDSTPVQGATAF